VVAACLAAAVLSSVAAAQSGTAASGGETTVFDEGPTAFGRALANLDPLRWNELRAGKQRFVRQWPQRGPWADASSCAACHFRDGRGPHPDHPDDGRSHLLRLGTSAARGDPVYGIQLRRTGNGVPAPGQFAVHWEEIPGRYPSGEPYTLRRPVVHVSELAYGPLDARTRLSLRVPPAVFGLGLLEAVPEQEIVGFADPEDADDDGVSGKVQQVRDPQTRRTALGRFGWKASQPSLAAQTAAALAHDLGVANTLFSTRVSDGATNRDVSEPEIGKSELSAIVLYLRALAVPARRQWTEPVVLRGEALFSTIGCSDCHRRRLTTGQVAGWPELTRQTIHPYTDLLLHDMGPQLADEVADGLALGGEWRTPPLWGLGLLRTVSGPAGLLHDGRARSSEEAILWHGGEAEGSRNRFVALPRKERDALLEFLASL
jgi:CxxC motif-containing protein (DUF1111 family)